MTSPDITLERSPDSFTIGDFFPLQGPREAIYRLGSSAVEEQGGVPPEQAAALGFALSPIPDDDNLGGFIKVLGKSKDLKENVAELKLRLGDQAVDPAMVRGWAVRLGIGESVMRSFMSSNQPANPSDATVVMTDNVPNWMWKSAAHLVNLADRGQVDKDGKVVLAAGTGPAAGVNPETVHEDGTGGVDLPDGLTKADYAEGYILPYLERNGFTRVVPERVPSDKGRDMAKAAVARVATLAEQDGRAFGDERMLIVAPPTWVQDGDQLRRMTRENLDAAFDSDGEQLAIASYPVSIGKTGDEPPLKSQSLWTAPGIAGRAYRSFALHTR